MTDYSAFTERETRDVVTAAAPFQDGELTLVTAEEGKFIPGGRGYYPSVWIICEREDAPFAGRSYSTHLAVVRVGEHSPTVLLQNGTYDLTLDEASHRLPR